MHIVVCVTKFVLVCSVVQDNKCIVLNFSAAASLTGLRSLVDVIYVCHVILQVSCMRSVFRRLEECNFVLECLARCSFV